MHSSCSVAIPRIACMMKKKRVFHAHVATQMKSLLVLHCDVALPVSQFFERKSKTNSTELAGVIAGFHGTNDATEGTDHVVRILNAAQVHGASHAFHGSIKIALDAVPCFVRAAEPREDAGRDLHGLGGISSSSSSPSTTIHGWGFRAVVEAPPLARIVRGRRRRAVLRVMMAHADDGFSTRRVALVAVIRRTRGVVTRFVSRVLHHSVPPHADGVVVRHWLPDASAVVPSTTTIAASAANAPTTGRALHVLHVTEVVFSPVVVV